MRAGSQGIVGEDVLGDDEEVELLEGGGDMVGARQRDGGVGRHDPKRPDLLLRHRIEHGDGLEAFAAGHVRRLPEAADPVDLDGRVAHMGGEHVGETQSA